MSKNSLTDAGVGRALFTTRFRLSLQAGIMCITFGAIPGLVIPYAAWFFQASPFDVDLVRFDMVAGWVGDTTPHRWRFRDKFAERKVLTIVTAAGEEKQWLTAPQARRAMSSFPVAMRTFRLVSWTSAALSVLGFLGVWWWLRRYGSGSQENQRIRGAQLVITAKELDRAVRRRGGVKYSLVGVALPPLAPMAGMLLLGAQGSGKSLGFHDLMHQAMAAGRKCIILDQSGEFFKAHFRPGKDVFFNPALIGSVPWSLFSEMKDSYNAATLAEAFLPPKGGGGDTGSGAFFENAARALFTTIVRRLKEAGAMNTSDIAEAVLNFPAEEMDHLIRNSVASSAMGGDSKQQRQGVIASIAIYLDGIAAVQPGSWSMRDFIDGPEDARFFILSTEDTRAMFSPLFRLLLTVAFSAIAARMEDVREDKYWFFLDEVNTLGDLKLDSHLALVRKSGVCVVAGLQSESQMAATMGKDRAATVSNCFNTALMLRTNDATMQESSAKRLGKLEMDTVTRNQALAVAEWRDGAGLNKSEHEKWLVMPSQFGDLEPCNGWIKLFGSYPPARVDYSAWLPRRTGARCHADRFKALQSLPPKDPRFSIRPIQTHDALGTLKQDFDSHKAKTKPSVTPATPVAAAVPTSVIPKSQSIQPAASGLSARLGKDALATSLDQADGADGRAKRWPRSVQAAPLAKAAADGHGANEDAPTEGGGAFRGRSFPAFGHSIGDAQTVFRGIADAAQAAARSNDHADRHLEALVTEQSHALMPDTQLPMLDPGQALQNDGDQLRLGL